MASAKRKAQLIAPFLGNRKARAAMQRELIAAQPDTCGFGETVIDENGLDAELAQCIAKLKCRQSNPLSQIRLLFDHNIKSPDLVAYFRAEGFTVLRLHDIQLNDRACDQTIASKAIEHNCIIATFDRDFARIYRARLEAGKDLPSVILFPNKQGCENHDPDKNPVMARVVSALVSLAQDHPDCFNGRLTEAFEDANGCIALRDVRDPDNPVPVNCLSSRRGPKFGSRPAQLG